MSARPWLLLAALALPAQALELDHPEIRFAPDCTVALTLRLLPGAEDDLDRFRFEIASPPTYRKLERAYPSWAGSAQLERVRHAGENRVQVHSAEPLPAHSSVLVLVVSKDHEIPLIRVLSLPPCNPAGEVREVAWGDTLLEIALEYAQALDTDAYTLMLAIQLHNRDTFIHDNINLLRAGSRLHIPSRAEIVRLNLPRQWLIDEVRYQNEQWERWRSRQGQPQESPALRARRLQLVPLDAPVAPPPMEPDPAQADPVEHEAAKPGLPTHAGTEPGLVRAEVVPERTEITERTLQQPPDMPPGEEPPAHTNVRTLALWALAAAGGLLLIYLSTWVIRRWRQTQMLRRSMPENADAGQRATAALNLAHAHAEMKNYDRALPLIRLVLSDGTAEEREEAKQLKERIARC